MLPGVLAGISTEMCEELWTATHTEPTKNRDSLFSVCFYLFLADFFISRLPGGAAESKWGVCTSCVCPGTVPVHPGHAGNTACLDCDPLSHHLYCACCRVNKCFSYELYFSLQSIFLTSKEYSPPPSMHQFFVHNNQSIGNSRWVLCC